MVWLFRTCSFGVLLLLVVVWPLLALGFQVPNPIHPVSLVPGTSRGHTQSLAWSSHHGRESKECGTCTSTRLRVRSSSPFLLQANLLDWLNPSSSSSDKKKKTQQEQKQGENGSNTKETTTATTTHHATHHQHKTAATPVVADFFSQWFPTNPPSPSTQEDKAVEATPVAMESMTTQEPPVEVTQPDGATILASTASLDHDKQEHHQPLNDIVTTAAATTTTTTTTTTIRDPSTTSTATTIHKGRVLWYNPRRGYGFVLPEDTASMSSTDHDTTTTTSTTTSNKDVDPIFVHNTAIDLSRGYFRTLIRGESVEFQLDVDDQGRRIATHVTGPRGTPVKSILQQERAGPPKNGPSNTTTTTTSSSSSNSGWETHTSRQQEQQQQ